MADIKHLRLVLPDVLARLREMQQRNATADVPVVLRMLLQQGVRQCLWSNDELASARLDPWQQSLLQAVPLELRAHGLASAALNWRGEGGMGRGGTWLQVEAIYLEAGLDDLRLAFPPALSVAEATQLSASLQPLFSLAGFELQTSSLGNWYLWRASPLDVATYSPRSGFATRMYDIMPRGTHGAELRRLMTEAQMLLHQHPVNLQREQRGIATANALWFWGAGSPEMVTTGWRQRILSNRPYVQGLCEHLHVSCWPLPPDAAALLSLQDDEVLAVVNCESLRQLADEWLQPIALALQRGYIGRLDLYLDQWRVTFHGGRWQQLRRYVSRGAHELTEILA
jgi:hypothetical protein